MIRLDPPYLVSIVLILGLAFLSSAIRGFGGSEPQITLTQVLLHVGYLNALAGYPWLNDVYWTLAVEVQYYILIALIFPLVAHKRSVVRVATLASLCVVALTFGYTAHSNPAQPDVNCYVIHWLSFFALGILVFYFYAGWLNTAGVALGIFAITCVLYLQLGLQYALVGLSAAAFIAFVDVPNHVTFFLGTVSYSYYLVHQPIGQRIIYVGSRFGRPLEVATVVFAVALSLATSFVLFEFVERPSQRWASRIKYRSSNRGGSSTKREQRRISQLTLGEPL